MKIALVMEQGQGDKNSLVFQTLQKAAQKKGHTVDNYGAHTTFVTAGVLASALIASGCADFVVSGCGTGIEICMAMNAMPCLRCGLVTTPLDVFMFTQINHGNAISLALEGVGERQLAQSLQLLFETLFEGEWGAGYPPESAEFERINRGILVGLKQTIHYSVEEMLQETDAALVREAFGPTEIKQLFLSNSKRETVNRIILEKIG